MCFNDPFGLADADPKDDPTGQLKETKILPEVVVKGVRKLTHNQMQAVYWDLRQRGIEPGTVQNPVLRSRLERWDGISRYMEKVHAGVKEDGLMILEGASWFIPTGWLTKLKYLKYAANLFRAKRAFTALTFASKYGINTYRALKNVSPLGSHVHHLIEKRFARLFNVAEKEMQSIVVTEAEHKIFTNAWRSEIGYEGSKAGLTTANAVKADVELAAQKIYKDYPEILKALGL